MFRAFFFALLVLAPLPVAAQCPPDRVGCHSEDVAFHWEEGFLDSMMFDTGWVPSGSPLQVRFAVSVGGRTEIDLGGTTHTWWPAPLTVQVPGTRDSARLSIDYGIEILARIRIDVTIAGIHYRWEGDVPLGSVPHDVRMAAEEIFDSFLLPPRTPRPIAIADSTEPIRVYEVGLTDSFISIPGISGGLTVDVAGMLSAAYQTDRIDIGDAPLAILEEDAFVVTRPDPGATGFGAAKDVVVGPVGTLDYDGTLHVLPELYIEIAGRRISVASFDVPIPIASFEREVVFDPATVHVPLPDVRVMPREIDFGAVDVGDTAVRLLDLGSEGEAELVVTPRMPRAPFDVDGGSIVLAPRTSRMIEVRFAPDVEGVQAGMILLDTNDPDEPLVAVRVRGEGIAAAVADGGVPDAGRIRGTMTGGGCGCRASGRGDRGAVVFALVALALWTRRRRTSGL